MKTDNNGEVLLEESYTKIVTELCLVQCISEVYESTTKTRQVQDGRSLINAHTNTAWELREKRDLTQGKKVKSSPLMRVFIKLGLTGMQVLKGLYEADFT